MTKFKVGDKVRVTGLTIFGKDEIGKEGEVYEVDTALCFGGRGLCVDIYGRKRVYKYEDVELIPQKPTKKQRIKALESEVAELKAKVEALEKAQAKPKFVPVTTDNIAVGDKIRVVNVRAIDDCGANLVQGGTYVVVRVDPDGNFLIRNGAKEAYIVEEEFRYIKKVVSE